MTSLNQPKDQPRVDRSFTAMLDLGIVITAIQWALYVNLAWLS